MTKDNVVVRTPDDNVDNNVDVTKLVLAPDEKKYTVVGRIESEQGIKFGVIACGQGGCRIGEVFYKLGYESVFINTARQDLDGLGVEDDNKIFIDYALGGAGKDPNIGRAAIEEYLPNIKQKIDQKILNADAFLIIASLGGGTGTGALIPIINLLRPYDMPILVMATLPMVSEDSTTKKNAVTILESLINQFSAIDGVIVVDNAKIESKFPNASQLRLWTLANKEIAQVFHLFNSLSQRSTPYQTLDAMDLAKVMFAKGFIAYGETLVEDFDNDSCIADAIERCMNETINADFNVGEATHVGVIITGSSNNLDRISALAQNFGFDYINKKTGASVYRGIYAVKQQKVKVHIIFSGLNVPQKRIEKLIQDSNVKTKQVEIKTNVFEKNSSTDIYSKVSKNKTIDKIVRRRRGRL